MEKRLFVILLTLIGLTWIGLVLGVYYSHMHYVNNGIEKPVFFEEDPGVKHVSQGVARVLEYDSCGCVEVLLPNGKYHSIKSDKCTPLTELMHYTDQELDAIYEYLYLKHKTRFPN